MTGNGRESAMLAARRERIMAAMGGGVMLLAAAPERPRTTDILYPYRQDSDFDYVTGFAEPEAVCVLAPDAPERYVLFVRPHDPERAIWVGRRAGIEGAVERHAHREAMRTARPGMAEFELEALVDFTFRRRGATGPAYPSIIASGPNATILHYVDNDRVLGDSELLLIDAGAEHAGYCADVTRTFPIGRRYTPAQRTLYDAVLAAQLAAIDTIRPGATLEGAHRAAVQVLVDALLAEHLLEGSRDEIVEKGLYRRFYMHRTSHWLGRDVHDVGNYAVGGAPRPLEPGMVLTVEPGLYVAPDADDVPAPFRGIGIRIEDDVLVTETGHEVLSAAAPKQVAEIEALRA